MIFNIKMYEPKKSYAVVKSTGYESVLRHSHEFVEMVFVESGSAVQKVNSETVELRRGDMSSSRTTANTACAPPAKKTISKW